MGIPTYTELCEAAGFPVPPSLRTLWEVAAALNPKDPSAGIDHVGGGLLLMIPNEAEEIQEVPCNCVAFARLCDGSQLVFVIDDAGDKPIERPVACFTYVGIEPSLYGLSLPGAIVHMLRSNTDDDRSDAELREALLLVQRLKTRPDEPITEGEIILSRWREGAVCTADNIGVVVPDRLVSRSCIRRSEASLDGRSPKILDEAERRLRAGEIGTALVLARNFYWHGFTQTEHLLRTADILSRAYTALGRPLIAAKAKRQAERQIARNNRPKDWSRCKSPFSDKPPKP